MSELLAIITAIVKDWVSGYQKIQQAKQDVDLAGLNNKARLLADKQTANSAWEMAALTNADKAVKRLSFCIFFSPLIIGVFAPHAVADYFKYVVATMPDWYMKTIMGITGSVWGIASLKDTIPGIINQVKAWKNPDEN